MVEQGQDTVLNFSESLTLFDGYGYQNYLWGNGFSGESLLVDSSILVAGANEITVMVTDSNNCTAFDTLNVFYFDFQSINLVQGWSIISTYINPVDPNIASVMSVLDTNLIIVKNDSGYIYWPDYGINTIGELVIGEGYQLKVFSSQSLNVTGTILVPELTPININQGWNLIGYLRTTPALIDIMLLSIVNDIILVKDSDGFVYWPTYGINAIVNMNPGEGYQIKMSQLINFQYPQN